MLVAKERMCMEEKYVQGGTSYAQVEDYVYEGGRGGVKWKSQELEDGS